MPKSIPELLVLVSLGIPGLAFFFVRSQHRVAPERSALLQSANLVAVGFAADIAGLGVVALAHVVVPSISPDLRLLALDGSKYLRGHFWLVVAWWIAAIGIATAIAVLAARQKTDNNRFFGLLRGPVASDSSWELVFNRGELEQHYKWCTLVLTDGRRIAGLLASSSPDPRETDERDLVLAQPIFNADGADEWTPSEAMRLVVSATQIATIEVVYYSELPTFGT